MNDLESLALPIERQSGNGSRARYSLGLSLLCMVAVLITPARADRIYSFISYPINETDSGCCSGGVLAGDIAVTDDATADGILAATEIVEWKFTHSPAGPLAQFTTSDGLQIGPPAVETMQGVVITPSFILLPDPDTGQGQTETLFKLHAPAPPDVGSTGIQLFYQKRLAPLRNDFGCGELDIDGWHTFPTNDELGGNPWVIAKVVPEPTTMATWLALPIAWLGHRRRRRVNRQAIGLNFISLDSITVPSPNNWQFGMIEKGKDEIAIGSDLVAQATKASRFSHGRPHSSTYFSIPAQTRKSPARTEFRVLTHT